jgi:L-ascorbate metabolism protein UlaG (beta-lactamase superfamily)
VVDGTCRRPVRRPATDDGGNGERMQVSHLGHASLLVETDRARVLVDPGTLSHGWLGLTDLAMVVVTHQHADHVDVERLRPVLTANPGATLVTEAATAALLAEHDVRATVLAADEAIRAGDLTVTGHGTTHARIHPRIPPVPNLGVVVEQDDGARILHPGDALEVAPSVDVVALPIAAPWASVAMLADWAVAVAAPHAVPIHDALLSPAGRAVHIRLVRELTDDIAVADLADGSRLTL